MPSRLVALALVVLAVGAVLGTAGAPGGGADKLSKGVYLEPAESANGQAYASYNSQGEVEVHVNGLLPDSTTTIDDLVVIGVQGNAKTPRGESGVPVWIEDGTPQVTFYRMDTREPIESAENAVELKRGGTMAVGVRVDAESPGTVLEQVTLHANVGNARERSSGGGGGGGGGGSPPALSPSGELDEGGSVSLRMSDGSTVQRVNVTMDGQSGRVEVRDLGGRPSGTPATHGSLVSVVEVDAPDPKAGNATVTFRVSKEVTERGVAPDNLVVEHYVNGTWRVLETTVTETKRGYQLTVETSGFSPFAVTELEQAGTTTSTTSTPTTTTATSTTSSTATATTAASSTTSTRSPGFGVGVGLVALLTAAVLALRCDRRD
ncbi:PGF-pre-PGF domain-containing protein [Halocalculus aciditolerans]|uniref:PGF-CTERM archaeal protein-sorting signal domain-containing protein n=1 Tax=Halocalculus aciditolerans TaxID=1383812 RepID=A0A830FIC1_9EURY|nr:PGF-pre-PGF domain-containing protein [Halocalculus aciditolerans]GGL58607.1 hypothetical protein GCM10009039_16070 [Halocalculus aciditolerans]